jgi:hypothetical protein
LSAIERQFRESVNTLLSHIDPNLWILARQINKVAPYLAARGEVMVGIAVHEMDTT